MLFRLVAGRPVVGRAAWLGVLCQSGWVRWVVCVWGFEIVFSGFGVFVDFPAVVVDFVVAVVADQCEVVEVGGSVL